MKDVKRSIVLPEEMAKLLDQMAEEQDVSFSGSEDLCVRA
jgi:hypothetical protein